MWVLQVGEGGRLECAGIGGTLIPLETMDREIIKKKKKLSVSPLSCEHRHASATTQFSTHTHTHTFTHNQHPLLHYAEENIQRDQSVATIRPVSFFFSFHSSMSEWQLLPLLVKRRNYYTLLSWSPPTPPTQRKIPRKKKKLRALMRPAERPMRPSTNARSGAHLRRAAHAQCSAPAPPASAAHAQSRTRQQRRPARRRGGG